MGRRGGGRGRGDGTALLEMSYKVLFMERTADGDNAMDIDRNKMSEA